MSILNRVKKIFGNSGSRDSFEWDQIHDNAEVDAIVRKSFEKPQIIYKHSSACGTSWYAKSSLESRYTKLQDEAAMYFVDVIRQRSLSDYIEQKLSVRHESPQLLLIQNGNVIWNVSHGNVRGEKAVEKLVKLQKAS